jgi:hypothetical protein
MELSPPSMRTSISPVPNRAQRLVRSNPEEVPSQMSGNQEFGLYGYRLLDALDDHERVMQSLPPSTTIPEFSDSSIHHRNSSRSSPNILSAEYDPFAPFHSDMGSSYAAALFNRRSTELSLPPASPSLSAVASHRSSFSSAPASETYSHSESYPVLHPRIKIENRLEWSSDGSTCLVISAPQTVNSTLATSSSSYPVSLEDSFFQEHGGAGWPKDVTSDGPNSHTTTRHTMLGETFRYQETEPKGPFGNVARTRTPRKMTTREEANYQCKAKGCGKLFSRSYNFKAHMETHDSSRVHPFPCLLPDCGKKFVRKTDLQRHHQSVHMKERNFRCDFCSRYFARKDTLRRYVRLQLLTIVGINTHRHMEDGCSKRFDLALGYNQYPGTSQEELKNVTHPASIQPPFSSTSTTYPSIPTRPSSTLPANYLSRADFRSSENSQGLPWPN